MSNSQEGIELFNKDIQSAQELTNFVKGLLDQMNDRFKHMTDNVITR